MHSGRDPSPPRRERGALAASGVASSQPPRRYLASPRSTCRPVCRVPEVGPRASEVLGPSSTHALGMSEAVARHGIVIVTSGWVTYCTSKRSSTCRERVTEVEEAFISKVKASYACITYRMRPPSRAGCSPGLYPDIESELRPRCGSAARQELAPGPDWP